VGLPLLNVRILDLTGVLAGPYCTMILGDLGAEVIKIEVPDVGEPGRGMPPYYFEGESAYFIALNRNKKSVTLNLKSARGREIFYELVKNADVVTYNFRPGVVEKLGADYDVLKTVNPGIICCSITGYGETGPFKDRPAFDLIIQARGGIMSYTGEPGRKPVKMGAPMADLAAGLFAANGILAALYQRERTGRGQKVDISMLDCQISLNTYRAQNYFIANEVAKPLGSGHGSVHPLRDFKTKTFDVVIDCNTQKIFNDLCDVIGVPELAVNPKFNSRENRAKNKEELYDILDKAFLTKTGEQWLELLDRRIPIAPVNTIDKALSDPQILSRNMVIEINYGNDKNIKILGNPLKMSEIDQEVFKAPPRLGEDTGQILAKILSYSPEKIEELRRQGII
jgi:CoA:oxalate CoA-transferase